MVNSAPAHRQPSTRKKLCSNDRLPKTLEVLLGVVVALELIAPFFAKSYGVDGPSQLNLLGEFTNLVFHGVLLPRWAPEGVFGFGIGSFYFYPPVAFYLSSIVRLLTGSTDIQFLFQMTGLVATILTFFAARPLFRALGASRYGTNLGALLYAFAPFQIAELYSRSSLSSHVGYLFVPLVWYGLIAILGGTRLTRSMAIVVLGVSSALIALASIPLTLAMLLCIAIAAIMARHRITRPALFNAVLAGILAAALSAFHFSAVLSARPYAQLKDLTVVFPEFLLTDILRGADLPAAYHAGILYLGCALIGFLYWRSRLHLSEPERMLARITLFIGGFIALLELPFLSTPLWGNVQPFMLIQGCWRFYIQLAMAATVVVAIASTVPMKRVARTISWIWILGAIVPGLLVVLNLHVYPHAMIAASDPSEYLPIYTIPVQRAGAQRLKDHASDPAVLADLQPGESLEVSEKSPEFETINTSLRTSRQVTFHRFFWPYWRLSENGLEIPSHPDSIGRAVAVVPAGNYTATWRLIVSPMEQAGRWISLFTICGIAAWCVAERMRARSLHRKA